MKFLSLTVVEITFTKKCYGITEGRTDGTTDRCKPVYPPHTFSKQGINRRRPIFNPTKEVVVVKVYTKFEVSILNGCGDTFDE